jgi:hypothetical protein
MSSACDVCNTTESTVGKRWHMQVPTNLACMQAHKRATTANTETILVNAWTLAYYCYSLAEHFDSFGFHNEVSLSI